MAAATVERCAIGALGPGVATLGQRVDGTLFGWDLRFEGGPHLILAGKSGSGKSTTARTLMAGWLHMGAHVVVLEPKVGDYAWADGVVSRVKTPDGWTAALKWAQTTAGKRQAQLDAYSTARPGEGVDKYHDLPNADPPIVVVVEETAALIGRGSGYDPRTHIRKWFELLWDVTQRGRSADVHLVYVVQMPTLISFGGDSGNGIRSSAAARITHDRNVQSLQAMFDASASATPEIVKRIEQGRAGRVAYSFLDRESSGEVNVGQVIGMTQRQAHSFAVAYQGPDPIDFDAIGAEEAEEAA